MPRPGLDSSRGADSRAHLSRDRPQSSINLEVSGRAKRSTVQSASTRAQVTVAEGGGIPTPDLRREVAGPGRPFLLGSLGERRNIVAFDLHARAIPYGVDS